MTDTTAPLRIRITDTLGGIPNSTLAEIYIAPAEVPTSLAGDPYFNVTGMCDSATLLLEAGQQYALVFDSAEPEANYRIHGSNELPVFRWDEVLFSKHDCVDKENNRGFIVSGAGKTAF